MATYHSGLLIASAVASDTGMRSLSKSILRIVDRDDTEAPRKRKRRNHPLNFKQKRSLLRAILHDDWRE